MYIYSLGCNQLYFVMTVKTMMELKNHGDGIFVALDMLYKIIGLYLKLVMIKSFPKFRKQDFIYLIRLA